MKSTPAHSLQWYHCLFLFLCFFSPTLINHESFYRPLRECECPEEQRLFIAQKLFQKKEKNTKETRFVSKMNKDTRHMLNISSILMLFYYLAPLQNDTILTSQCMQFTFGDKEEVYLVYESVLPVTKKERRREAKRSISPKIKYGDTNLKLNLPFVYG